MQHWAELQALGEGISQAGLAGAGFTAHQQGAPQMNRRVHGLKKRLTLAIRAQAEVFTPALGCRVVVLNPQQLHPSFCVSYSLLLQLVWGQKATPRGGWRPAVDICTVSGNVLLRGCIRANLGYFFSAKH
jgi:hypothetical protein